MGGDPKVIATKLAEAKVRADANAKEVEERVKVKGKSKPFGK